MTTQRSFAFNYSAPEKIKFARRLRAKSTYAERLFWRMVRNRSLSGLKIRRQHPIGPYIADFYCHELKLVIEIDGLIHSLPEIAERDNQRTAYLEQQGLRVLRFTNDEVLEGPEFILNRISSFLE